VVWPQRALANAGAELALILLTGEDYLGQVEARATGDQVGVALPIHSLNVATISVR